MFFHCISSLDNKALIAVHLSFILKAFHAKDIMDNYMNVPHSEISLPKGGQQPTEIHVCDKSSEYETCLGTKQLVS